MSKKISSTPTVRHICNRCGIRSTVIDARYAEFLPHGWAHLRYVDPEPFAEDTELDFCTACSLEIIETARITYDN